MNFFKKTLLKLNDPIGYKHFKFERILNQVQHPSMVAPGTSDLHFKHSGNVGDIIYALPCIFSLAKQRNIHLHLNINQKGSYGKMHHPLGTLMLNEKMVDMLKPLLLTQKNILTCDIFNQQHIDYDLDKIRELPLLLDRGNIARWYFLAFGVNFNLCKSWLKVLPDETVCNTILVSRSHRYHTPGIDYRFLNKYPEVLFVGLPEEYELMKKMVPNIIYRPTNDFLELAQLIAGCKLFIGNQSFPFAVAEALKVKRVLEVYFRTPNVTVYGEDGYDFCFQPQFEKIVALIFAGEDKNENP